MSELRVPNVNFVIISGRATRDPTLSYTEGGTAFMYVNTAVNRNYKDQQGEWQQEVAFLSVAVWGKLAERMAERIKKGTPIVVQGRLTTYTKEEGDFKRTHTHITANTIQILEKLSQYTGSDIPPEPAGISHPEPEEDYERTNEPDDDDDLPF